MMKVRLMRKMKKLTLDDPIANKTKKVSVVITD